jgi:hypothetical protein
MPHVKTARDGNTVPNPYGEVEGIFRAGSEILSGIKNKLQEKGLVEGRIIRHPFITPFSERSTSIL